VNAKDKPFSVGTGAYLTSTRSTRHRFGPVLYGLVKGEAILDQACLPKRTSALSVFRQLRPKLNAFPRLLVVVVMVIVLFCFGWCRSVFTCPKSSNQYKLTEGRRHVQYEPRGGYLPLSWIVVLCFCAESQRKPTLYFLASTTKSRKCIDFARAVGTLPRSIPNARDTPGAQ
jgi:hypothetical protein